MERLMLLDANGLIYRAYFALLNTPLTTSKGELVNAVFGFWSIVLRGFQDMRPDYVIAAFDLAGPTFRHAQFAEYKATRKQMPDDLRDQFPKVRELIEAFRIPIYQLEGFEADDVIGTLVRQAQSRDLETTIVSGDLDMLQLAGERTSVMTTRGGVQMTVVYDPAKILDRYGLRPDQMIDYKALKGDATDNIPGIPGVGEKTAAKLIAEHENLEQLYGALESVKPDKLRLKLEEHRDQVFRSRDLVTIHCDLPVSLELEPARLGDYDRAEVLRLFREYEFRSLVERLPTLSDEEQLAPGELLRQADRSSPVPAAIVPGRVLAADRRSADGSVFESGTGLQLSLELAAPGRADPSTDTRASGAIVTREPADRRAALGGALRDPAAVIRIGSLDGEAAWLAAQDELTVALSLDDARPRRGELTALAVAGRDGRVIAASADDGIAARLLDAVVATGRSLVGHETKQLLVHELDRRDPDGRRSGTPYGESLPPIAFDTQIAAYILNAALRSQTLADIAAERLGAELPAAGALGAVEDVGVRALAVAAARDLLGHQLTDDGGETLEKVYRELELPLIPVLATMEATGVAIDMAALAELREIFSAEIGRLESGIFESVGHQFNLGSPKQLEQVLFYELNLPKGTRTKTGYSTAASVLEDLRPAHPMIDMLLDWRTYTKLKSTYIDALPSLIDPHTGRLHTTFHQAVASTGRLSSTDPNLQNIPIRTELGRRIRRAFVAGDPETVLLAADYSQIELRILAHVSGDVHLREAFERRADVHRETAALVLRKAPQDVTPNERSMAKMVNFGIAYGMSDFGLSSRAHIPRADAQTFINNYFATYSGISYYMLHIKDLARRQGYVSTLLGRRRWIPELEARNQTLRSAGERMAINMPIQGTAADIMKIALIRVHDRLRREGSRARMLLTVHDELVFEVPRHELDAVAPIVRSEMESALTLDVPLTVDLKSGPDWEALTPMPDPA